MKFSLIFLMSIKLKKTEKFDSNEIEELHKNVCR